MMTEEDSVAAVLDEAIATARERLRRLEKAREALGAPTDGVTVTLDTVKAGATVRPLAGAVSVVGLSIPNACEKVLEAVGKPLKARALADAIMRAGYEYPFSPGRLRLSLAGSMDRLVKSDKDTRFTKPKPGTYALAKWEQKDPPASLNGSQSGLPL